MKKFDISKPYQIRTGTARTPNAEFFGVLQADTIKITISSDQYRKWEALLSQSFDIAFIYYVMCLSGCRISELLSLRGCDFVSDYQVVINGKKGSASRIINVAAYHKHIALLRKLKQTEVFNLNYEAVYRLFKKVGIRQKKRGSTNWTVCHLPRYNYIKGLRDMSIKSDTIQDIVGHRSKKSTAHYLEELDKF